MAGEDGVVTFTVKELLSAQAEENRNSFTRVGETLARLEGSLQHVATKEDVAKVDGRVDILFDRVDGVERTQIAEGAERSGRQNFLKWGGWAVAFCGLPALAIILTVLHA